MSATSIHAGLATPEFVRSAEIVLELHRKMAAGADEDDESEELRDESEPLWWKLSETQRRAISGLSADFFSFTDRPAELGPPDPQFEQAMGRMRQAVAARDWLASLELNRRWRTRIAPVDLALRRADAWQKLGLPAIAFAFADFALKLDRLMLPAGWCRMDALAAIDSSAPRRELLSAAAVGVPLSPGEVCWVVAEAIDRDDADQHKLSLLAVAAVELSAATTLSNRNKELYWQLVVDLGRLAINRMGINTDWKAWCADLRRNAPSPVHLQLPPEGFFEAHRATMFRMAA